MRLRYRLVLWTFLIVAVAIFLYLPIALHSAREAAKRAESRENLEQIRIGLDAYMQREKSGFGQYGIPPRRGITDDLKAPSSAPSK